MSEKATFDDHIEHVTKKIRQKIGCSVLGFVLTFSLVNFLNFCNSYASLDTASIYFCSLNSSTFLFSSSELIVP